MVVRAVKKKNSTKKGPVQNVNFTEHSHTDFYSKKVLSKGHFSCPRGIDLHSHTPP